MKISFFLLIYLLLAAGCSRNVEDHTRSVGIPPVQTFLYECAELEFVVRIEGKNAWLFLPGKSISLPRIPSASGTRYEDTTTQFWSKGEEAMLDWNGKQYKDCRNNGMRAVWEHAKLNGIDFRAVGNEPGWYLEIRDNNGTRSIILITDYGNSSHSFDSFERKIEQAARRTHYYADFGKQQLEVILEGKPCMDTMVDVSYESTVTVRIDDREFTGCGKALH